MGGVSVHMIRQDMASIPQYPLPAGYRLRLWRPGDRKTWLRIEQAVEPAGVITAKLFHGEFGDDLPAMAKRCYFLLAPDGEEVGTITAWYLRRYLGRAWGRIHYVAIVPAHQGRGLSRCILSVAMERLRSLGHRRAMLVTQTHRIRAIRTYLRFGFVPDMTRGDAAWAWGLVRQQIDHPALGGP